MKSSHSRFQTAIANARKHYPIYILVLPALAFFIVFKYFPMYGIQLAFREFRLYTPYHQMPWLGLEKFTALVAEPEFWSAFRNTVIISLYQLLFGFPVPVLLALLFSEIRFHGIQRFTQTVLTFPHFLSWVILSGVFFNVLGSSGFLNNLLEVMKLPRQNFLMNPKTFRSLLVLTNVWKEAGWDSIIYIAAIMGVDTEMYEAAAMDGAGRIRQSLHITLPSIMGIVVVMFILRVGNILNYNFQQVFMLYSAPVYGVADVIETYIYRITFAKAPDYSFSTAVGVFKGVIDMFLLLFANTVAKRLGYRGIY